MYLGVVLTAQDLMLGLALALALGLYYERIIAAEEAFLAEKFGAPYREWAARVPAFWPRLALPGASALPFSWRSAIRREHTTVFFAILGLLLIELGGSAAQSESLWPVLAQIVVVFAAQIGLTALRHRTTIFAVSGR